MKIDILASGSAGNCIALTSGERTILIDAGVAKTKIEKRLLKVNIIPADVAAIFITHAHGDHVKGLPLANKYGIPVYAGEEEWKLIKRVDEELRYVIKAGSGTGIDYKFEVVAFAVHHDSHEPLGYTVEEFETGEKVSICLDTGKVDADMLYAMRNSDTYIIESNHDPMMVEASTYPTSVQVRVLSDIGHLSNEQTADALAKLLTGKKEKVYLMHLSSKNNMPTLAEMTIMRVLHKTKKFKEGIHYKLEVIE